LTTTEKGGTNYLWGSAQGNTFEHMQKFHDGLRNVGVECEEKPVEIRGFGTELRFNKIRDFKANWILRHPVWILMLTPFLMMCIVQILSLLI